MVNSIKAGHKSVLLWEGLTINSGLWESKFLKRYDFVSRQSGFSDGSGFKKKLLLIVAIAILSLIWVVNSIVFSVS